MNIQKIKTVISYPFYALFSKNFYFLVLFKLKGIGAKYLIALCLALAAIGTYKVVIVFNIFKSLNLPSIVTQIPPSYINVNGILSPTDETKSLVLIKDSSGANIILYNPQDQNYDLNVYQSPIELQSTGVMIRANGDNVLVPYSTFLGTDTNFEPLQTANALDTLLNISVIAIWPIVALWFFYMLFLNVCISALITRFVLIYFIKLKLDFRSVMRLASFANTPIALLLLLQFFVYFPFPFTVMLLIPIIYLVFIGRFLRNQILANQQMFTQTDLNNQSKQENVNKEADQQQNFNNNDQGSGGSFSA